MREAMEEKMEGSADSPKEERMEHSMGALYGKPPKKHTKVVDLTPVSKGHKPNGAHGRAAVKALGRTKTTGNFKKIEAAHGKGAAIAAYQNALKAHKAGK